MVNKSKKTFSIGKASTTVLIKSSKLEMLNDDNGSDSCSIKEATTGFNHTYSLDQYLFP